MAITWGASAASTSHAVRLGIELTASYTDTTVTVTAKYYIQTKYALSDAVNNAFTTGDLGSKSWNAKIETKNSTAWSADNIFLTATQTKTFTRGNSGATYYVAFSVRDIYVLAGDYPSVVATILTLGLAPAAPTNATHTRVSDSKNTVAWTNNSVPKAGANVPYTAVNIYRSVNGGAYDLLATLAGTATTYDDTTTLANCFYSYKVAGYANDQHSAQTSATATTYNTPITAVTATLPCYLPTFATAPQNSETVELGSSLQGAVGLQAGNNFLMTSKSAEEISAWNGSTFTAVTPAASDLGGAAIAVMQDRIFIGGKESSPNIIEYTEVDTIAGWANGGAMVLGAKGSGERIVAFGSYREMLITATDRALYGLQVKGLETDWVLKTLTTHQGCAAPRSMVSSTNGVMWLGEDGIYSYGAIGGFGGDGEGVNLLTKNISPTIKAIRNKDIAAGAYVGNKYYLSVALDSDTQNTHTLVGGVVSKNREAGNFDVSSDEVVWTLYDYGFTSFVRDGSHLYGGGYDGSIHELEVGFNDNGKPISLHYETPLFSNSHLLKDFRELTLVAHSKNEQGLSVTMNTDGTEDTPILLATSQAENASQRIPFRRKGYAVGAKIDATAHDQALYITQMTIPFTERRS